MKRVAAVVVTFALAACSTRHLVLFAPLDDAGVTGRGTLGTSKHCLGTAGLTLRTESGTPKHESTLRQVWAAEHLQVDVHEYPDHWRVRFSAAWNHEDIARQKQEEYSSCMAKLVPWVKLRTEKETGVALW